jgi:hypothetical protein
MWSLVLVSDLVTTTKFSSHYNLNLMMAGRLAPASEVAGSEDIPYHFKKGMVRQLKWYVLLRVATSELDALDQVQIIVTQALNCSH